MFISESKRKSFYCLKIRDDCPFLNKNIRSRRESLYLEFSSQDNRSDRSKISLDI